MNAELDKFGEFVVRNLRDKMLSDVEMLLSGRWKAPELASLQEKLSRMTKEERETVREVVEHVATSGLHDFLFALQEESDAESSVRVLVDGVEVAKSSDGMHGEIFTDEGWIARFSEFPREEKG